MSSTKVYLCDLCVILLFGFSFILADNTKTHTQQNKIKTLPLDEGLTGNCSCGGFNTTTPDNATEPLLSQSPGLVVRCNEEGETTCNNLCTALATAAKAKGPQILCDRLENADELKLSAFFKICDKPWVYANLTAEKPLCCNNTKVTTCASMEKISNGTTATTEIPIKSVA